MANNTLLDTLEEMGRGTAREIAERLKIEPFEALELLREHQELGEVEFMNGTWSLAGYVEQVTGTEPEVKEVKEAKEAKEIKEVSDLASDSATATVPGSEVTMAIKLVSGIQGDIIQLLSNNGAMTIKGLAAKMGLSVQAVASPMYALKGKGVVVKSGTRREASWRLLVQPASVPTPAQAFVSSEGLVKTIPAFTATATSTATDATTTTTATETTATSIAGEGDLVGQCIQDSFIYGLMTRANQEKQDAIERVAKLDEVCEALNVLHKHQALIQQFNLSDGKPEERRA